MCEVCGSSVDVPPGAVEAPPRVLPRGLPRRNVEVCQLSGTCVDVRPGAVEAQHRERRGRELPAEFDGGRAVAIACQFPRRPRHAGRVPDHQQGRDVVVAEPDQFDERFRRGLVDSRFEDDRRGDAGGRQRLAGPGGGGTAHGVDRRLGVAQPPARESGLAPTTRSQRSLVIVDAVRIRRFAVPHEDQSPRHADTVRPPGARSRPHSRQTESGITSRAAAGDPRGDRDGRRSSVHHNPMGGHSPRTSSRISTIWPT